MKSFKSILLSIAIIIILIAGYLTYTYGQETHSAQYTESITIGAILPLTGNLLRIGEREKNGLDMALEEINNSGGINGKKLVISLHDSQTIPKTAIDSWNVITRTHNPPVIIGTISTICQALSPLANSQHVVLMASDCNVADYSSLNDYTFRILSSNAHEGMQTAQYLIDHDIYSVGVLKISNAFGEGLYDAFSKEYIKLGGVIVSIESYSDDAKDFKTELLKTSSADPDIIYMISYVPDAELILQQIDELQISIPIYAAEPFENYTLLDHVREQAEGVIYFRPEISGLKSEAFISKYENLFSQKPEVNVARTYDALYVTAHVLRICDTQDNLTSECIRDELYAIHNFPGVVGTINFDEYGDVSIPYTVKTVKNGEFVKLKE